MLPRQRPILAIAMAAALAPGCASRERRDAPPAPQTTRGAGHAWTEADELFHHDARWIGADAALSIQLDPERTVWLFGDTFVATSPRRVRTESVMVRNSIGLERGLDPHRAAIEFGWREQPNGTPSSFFPERGAAFYWPGHGMRLDDGTLAVFLYRLHNTPGEGLGFDCDGFALALVDVAIDRPPSTWGVRIVDAPSLPFDALPATAVVADEGYVIGLAIRQRGVHAGSLVRYRASDLARGTIERAEWWMGEARGWVPTDQVPADGPLIVIDDAGAECSIHFDAATRRYVHVASYGFGASTIGVREAPALTGPWSAQRTVYRPPESEEPRPFVYAAKAHPELRGPRPDDLVVTYATNRLDFGELVSTEGQRSRYWPRFVVLPVVERRATPEPAP